MIRYAFMSVGVLLVTFSLATLAAEPLAVAPPPRLAVVELVRLLGSDKVQEREEATRKLAALELNEPPVPLLDATQSSNPELRQRAIQAVDAIQVAQYDRTCSARGAHRDIDGGTGHVELRLGSLKERPSGLAGGRAG